ncbi:MAG: hypothetical protein KDB93_13405 [Flavobacteriales bacterium]|nr:hypothetical protein [Flavobacteriales bacterium]
MERVETSTAFIELLNPHLVITRYKPAAHVTAEAVRENLEVRMAMPGPLAKAVIAIFPEDMDFDMSLLDRDHYMEQRYTESTLAMAVVSSGVLHQPLANLYIAYHPTSFKYRVFSDEREAIAWANEEVKLRLGLEN